MKRTLFCVAWLAIGSSGCATPEPPARIITDVRVEKVSVPVQTPCLKATDVPARPIPTAVDVRKADTRQLAAALAADVLMLDAYAEKAETLMRLCAGKP